jgi:tetratricopeptide (TPR) repeat protein
MSPEDDGLSDSPVSDTFKEAVAQLRRGNTVQAEKLVADAAHAARERFGSKSPEYASAECDLSNILLNVGAVDRAIASIRRAAAIENPDNRRASRDRLTYLMNLGMLLEQTGELDEAETVLRRGLDGRRAFYGPDHPGYGFGLEPLAAVLLAKGDLPEAERLTDEAVANFWKNRHERIASAIALRAEVRKSMAERPGFDALDELPDDMLEAIAGAVLRRGETGNPAALGLVIDELLAIVEERLGAGHPVAIQLLIARSNAARASEDVAACLAALARLVSVLDESGEPAQTLEALLALALAQGDAGRSDDALGTYARALELAVELGPGPRSNVERNRGLFLAHLEPPEAHRAEAEAALRSAVDLAESARDSRLLGASKIALGLFLQHRNDLEAARRLLDAGIRYLEPHDPDAISARSHLDAIVSGGACGCGDMDRAVALTLKELVLEQLPEGLLQDIRLDEKGVQVELAREPAPEELELLDRVIRHAQATIQKKIKSRYG